MKNAMRVVIVTVCVLMFTSLIVFVGAGDGFTASDLTAARTAQPQGDETVLEAYAILVIVVAVVISSVAYVFLRDPHKKERAAKEEKKIDKKD